MDNIIRWPEADSIEEEAAQWIVLLDSDEGFTEESRQALSEWLSRSPEHQNVLKKMNKFWSDNSLTLFLEPSLESVLERRSERQSFRGIVWRWLAFVNLGAVCVFVVFFSFGQQRIEVDALNGPYSTAIGQQMLVELSDGSVLEMNTNSQLKVDYGEDYRNIYLIQGEVHFRVIKNPESPFQVYARNSRVQAVGTAFTVYLSNREVEVHVTDGVVALAELRSADKPTDEAMLQDDDFSKITDVAFTQVVDLGQLSKGYSGTLKITDHGLSAERLELIPEGLVSDMEKRLAWRDGLLVFSGETLKEVVEEVQRYTMIEIEFKESDVANVEVAGQIYVNDTDAMLNALETNFGLEVNRLGYNKIQLSKKTK